ncbi:MAG: ATP-dependent DNA helicase RecQ [Myxococcales bacterium]|nr:ATP-dependent DNA helicase RecQ [Myxococcales bacterium]MDP3499803.1 ATP-dependent DNA helicase RecQ [Myxococcales bacterium]
MRAVSADLPFLTEMTKGLDAFALSTFRHGQAQVISSVLSGRNTVVVMPTGAGKSLCYQLPATLLDGVTVVVSPLIALMQDQVEGLTARGIPAAFINSTLSEGERADRQRKLRGGEYKLVYVAPERFRSEAFVSALMDARVALFAIDEAHCISQWGHDFRPDYALLGQVRKRLRPPRTVALTATATPEVRDDIARVLLMKEPQIFVAGFDRPNLFLDVVNVAGEDDKRRASAALANEGSGIIYCNTRKQAEGLHQALTTKKVDAVLYHAGMPDEARREAQEAFMARPEAVAVATNAFGMGIDKPGIRFVAHAGIPRAVEAYYQEIGRAGRDGQPAHAVLFFNHADVYTQERLIQSNHPPPTLFRDLWQVLRQESTFQRGVHQLAAQLGSSEFEVSAALKVLEREGLLARGSRGEGRYGITILPESAGHHPRSPEVKALWTALLAAFPVGTRATTELSQLGRRSGLDEERIRHGLSALERAGSITVQRPFAGRTIQALKDEPWDSLGVSLERVREQERSQLLLLKRMTEYAYTKRCRRGFLLRYFGEETPWGQQCGSCDVCAGSKVTMPSKSTSRADAPTLGTTALPGQYSVLAVEELKRFRRELSADLGVPPFIIFNDATLYGLAAALPTTKPEFLRIKGTGEAKWERFGAKITQICLMARAAGDVAQPMAESVAKRRVRRA